MLEWTKDVAIIKFLAERIILSLIAFNLLKRLAAYTRTKLDDQVVGDIGRIIGSRVPGIRKKSGASSIVEASRKEAVGEPRIRANTRPGAPINETLHETVPNPLFKGDPKNKGGEL